jgi:hypothetical protein
MKEEMADGSRVRAGDKYLKTINTTFERFNRNSFKFG